MDEILEIMLKNMNDFGGSFASCKIGKYTIMLTDDEDGAKYLEDAWDKYVDEEGSSHDGK